MTGSRNHRRVVAVSAATVAATLAATTVSGVAQGAPPDDQRASPTTSVEPYVLPTVAGVSIDSLLTVDDLPAQNGYDMVGIPDGLGAFRQDGKVVAFMNHELTDAEGITRAHGQKGSFVSRLEIDPASGAVTRGRDLIQDVTYWDYQARQYAPMPGRPDGATFGHTPAFSRFCSGYISEPGELFNEATERGTTRQLYFANEESGDEGRVFSVRMNGEARQLPRLGLFSWENTVSADNTTDTTVVMGNEDGNPGQLRVYEGRKRPKGFPERRAGLTNGDLYVVDAVNEAVSTDAQFRATFGKNTPVRVSFGAGERIDWTQSGAEQNAEALGKGLSLNRIEDGAFDPNDKNDYYFLTTEGGSTAPNPQEPTISRDGGGLWRLSFDDIEQPAQGGTLTLLLDGSEAPYLSKPDNMALDDEGNLVIQEDPGGNDHVARIVAYDIDTGERGVVARFDPALFGVSNPSGTTPDERAVLTTDEESSGIISTDHQFGDDTYLFDAQAHTTKGLPPGIGPGTVQELAQRGQLMRMEVGDWRAVYTIE